MLTAIGVSRHRFYFFWSILESHCHPEAMPAPETESNAGLTVFGIEFLPDAQANPSDALKTARVRTTLFSP